MGAYVLGKGGRRRWGPVLVGAAVLGAGLGGAAGELGAPAASAGAIAAITALLSGAFVGYYFPTRDQRTAAFVERDRVLDAIVPVRPSEGDAAADPMLLLRADRSPMPFRGRTREIRLLATWLTDKNACPVLLLSGAAGVGKSRLALEFASRIPTEWVAGWLHASAGDTAVAVVAACGDPALIVVDDADGRSDLIQLLDSLAEWGGNPAIRVILVTRAADGSRASLQARLEERHGWIVSSAPVVELAPEGSADDRKRWFGESVRAFAGALQRSAPALPEVFMQANSAAEPFVLIEARALLAVLGAESDPRRLTFGEVAGALMQHEKRRWNALAAGKTWGSGGPPTEPVQERCVAAMVLLGIESDAEAEEVLRRIPQLSDATSERCYEIASWISQLYPAEPGQPARIRPDAVGEWFVVSQLTANPELAEALRAGLTDSQAARSLGLLARAADWIESAGSLFAEFAGGDIRRQVLAAAEAALTGESGRRLLDVVVAEHIASTEGWSLDLLDDLEHLIPGSLLPQTRAVVADRIVVSLRVLVADNPDGYQAGLAAALQRLAATLGELGRYDEALPPAADAVALWQVLAAGDSSASKAELARAMGNLATWLGQLRRSDEALQERQASVGILRSLATHNPASYRADLAVGLADLGELLNESGLYPEGISALREAVSIYRDLAAQQPAIYQAALAMRLADLSAGLSHVGLQHEALDTIEQSVTIYRRLTADNPIAYQAHLARALGDLGKNFHDFGRDHDALQATEESITIFRVLAERNSATFLPNLAMTLNNRGNHLDRLGRRQEAMPTSAESVAIYRRLTADNPAAHQANLALALENLAIRYAHLGRLGEARTVIEESVSLYRDLAADNPSVHRAGLAASLHNLSSFLSMDRQPQMALDSMQECVAILRELSADNPAVHQLGLAMALHNLGTYLKELERDKESLAAWADSVTVYGQLATRDPDLYKAEYERQRGMLSRQYEQRGMRNEAITHHLKRPDE